MCTYICVCECVCMLCVSECVCMLCVCECVYIDRAGPHVSMIGHNCLKLPTQYVLYTPDSGIWGTVSACITQYMHSI